MTSRAGAIPKSRGGSSPSFTWVVGRLPDDARESWRLTDPPRVRGDQLTGRDHGPWAWDRADLPPPRCPPGNRSRWSAFVPAPRRQHVDGRSRSGQRQSAGAADREAAASALIAPACWSSCRPAIDLPRRPGMIGRSEARPEETADLQAGTSVEGALALLEEFLAAGPPRPRPRGHGARHRAPAGIDSVIMAGIGSTAGNSNSRICGSSRGSSASAAAGSCSRTRSRWPGALAPRPWSGTRSRSQLASTRRWVAW
jgi:hypothetical protein